MMQSKRIIFSSGTLLTLGVLALYCFFGTELPNKMKLTKNSMKYTTEKVSIATRLHECKTGDEHCKTTKNFKTSGHLRLPTEETLFESGTQRLGITNPWSSRLKRLQQECRDRKELYNAEQYKRFMFSNKYKFGFCKAPKTGCTFMASLFEVLELGRTIYDVFKRKRDATHIRTMEYLSKIPPKNDKFKKILVSRDPYSRLFSGYIDKIFLFGFTWAHFEVANYAGYKPYKVNGRQCGYVTPFQDFLELYMSHALETGKCNKHWMPVVYMCDPCGIDFQLILKTETLTNDTKFVLDQLNLEHSLKNNIMSALRHTNNQDDVIRGLVTDYIRYRKKLKRKCSKIITFMYRLWEGFKILGYVKSSVEFPESRFKALSNITADTASDIIIDTLRKNPLSKSEKSKQKRDAMVAAYRQVKPETIEKIKEYFKYDFLLFGYNNEPPLE